MQVCFSGTFFLFSSVRVISFNNTDTRDAHRATVFIGQKNITPGPFCSFFWLNHMIFLSLVRLSSPSGHGIVNVQISNFSKHFRQCCLKNLDRIIIFDLGNRNWQLHLFAMSKINFQSQHVNFIVIKLTEHKYTQNTAEIPFLHLHTYITIMHLYNPKKKPNHAWSPASVTGCQI